MTQPEKDAPRLRRVRPVHRLRFWWRTRHWDRAHGPGCPVRYGKVGECPGIDGWCVMPPEVTE